MTTKKIKDETLQVPRKIRGTLTAEGGYIYTFKPQGKGESAQQNVVTAGQGKMYDTVGKKPLRMVSLKVSSDAADVRSELFRQLDELTQGDKTEAERPPQVSEEVVCIHKSDRVRLYIDEKAHMVRLYHEIPMIMGTNYVGEMIKSVTSCSQSLDANRDKIRPLELRREGGEV